MTFASMAEFLALLQDNGELVRITASVDSALEMAAITDRVAKSSPEGGPAILFENVKNSKIPVVTNLLGSRRRLCLCLGVAELDDVTSELDRRWVTEQTGSWLDALKLVPGWGGMSKWSPKLVKSATCQQVVRLGRDVNLWDLPVPRCWPCESDPVITSGLLVTCHPTMEKSTIFNAPLVVTAQNELAIYDGDHYQRDLINAAIETKRNLPVAIVLGSDPIVSLAASLPGMSDPRLFAGLLRGASLEQVRCRSNELEVPAAAEIVIEGYLDAANPRSSKPLSVARGNGRYVRREMPIIQVTAITHRANPVFPATVVSSTPPGEESWVALACERMTLPLLKRLLPEIVDIHQPFSGAGRNLLFVSIHKSIEHQARRVLHALWGMELFGRIKTIVIVDADVDVHHEDRVWFTVGNNACPSRDFLFSDGLARDDDYTTLSSTLSSRVGIDATWKNRRESLVAWPDTLEMSDEIVAQVMERWSEYGLDR